MIVAGAHAVTWCSAGESHPFHKGKFSKFLSKGFLEWVELTVCSVALRETRVAVAPAGVGLVEL